MPAIAPPKTGIVLAREERQRELLKRRRNPSAPWQKPPKVRLLTMPITIHTDFPDDRDGRDIHVSIRAESTVAAFRQALDYIEGKLHPNESVCRISAGDPL